RRHTRFSRDWSSDVCSSDLFECAQVKGRDPGAFGTTVTVNFYADQSVTPFFTKSVNSDLEFLIPATICRELEVEIVGSARINQRSEERRVGKEVKVRGQRCR